MPCPFAVSHGARTVYMANFVCQAKVECDHGHFGFLRRLVFEIENVPHPIDGVVIIHILGIGWHFNEKLKKASSCERFVAKRDVKAAQCFEEMGHPKGPKTFLSHDDL